MSRMKTIFAVLMLAAIVGIVPLAQAQTLKVVMGGSTALWQTAALGTFGAPSTVTAGAGTCSSLLTGCVSPTFHWTSAKSGSGEPYLNDTRPSTPNQDAAAAWVVWDTSSDCSAGCNVWMYIKVDSVIGVRCFYAQPHCNLVLPNGASAAGSNLITVWNNSLCSPSCDTALPANIQAILNNGAKMNSAASDVRPEDAAFAMARINSKLGASTYSNGGSDGIDGMGYNVNNASGVPAAYPAGTTHGVGNPILSGMPGSTQQAGVLAFNISGKDPFTNTTIPAATVTNVGGEPLVFITGRQDSLANLTNATEYQLQQAFGGNNCDASAFGLPNGGINIFLREPTSGTYNSIEQALFRRPTVYTGSAMAAGTGVLGVSQETNIGPIVVGTVGTATTANDPLTALSQNPSTSSSVCVSNATGKGGRYRGIGTGEVVEGVLSSHNTLCGKCFPGSYQTAQDGITYTFFSYGNVSSLANNANFGYIEVNGVDPIFSSYSGNLDPGQLGNAPGTIPGNTPCGTTPNAFPCQESKIWANGFSFPNVRNGLYRTWNILRTIAGTGAPATNVGAMVKASQGYVVGGVPDYIPYVAVTCNATSTPACSPTVTDVGLKLLRSHYEQRDGNGVKLGGCATIKNTTTECGGDAGGFIIPTTIGATTSSQLQLVQNETAAGDFSPVARPK